MVQIRRMVCAFPFFLESKRHHHSLICIKSWLKILKGSRSLSMDSLLEPNQFRFEGSGRQIQGVISKQSRLLGQSVVDDYCGDMLVTFGSSPGAVTTVPSGECANHGDELVVNVAYQYEFLLIPDFLTAFFTGDMPGSINVSAVTRMRCE